MNLMLAYHWPGNVRELENTVERAVLTSHDDVIHAYNLPPALQEFEARTRSVGNVESGLAAMVGEYEKSIIMEALKLHRANVAATARYLKTTPRILRYKIDRLNISLSNFR